MLDGLLDPQTSRSVLLDGAHCTVEAPTSG
jgi:hypothetical protein